jgi:ketosteroid isomerase-like protein
MKTLLNATLTLTLLLIIGCDKSDKSDTASEQEKVKQVFTDFINEIEEGNVDGYFSYITDDFIGYDSGREPITNLDTFRIELEEFFAANTFRLTNHKSEEVIVRDDIAIHRHRGLITIRPKADTLKIQMDAKYLDILKKNESGDWKIYIHSVSPNN